MKREARVCGLKVVVSRWREGMQESPASASLGNPDRSCLPRSSWWRGGGEVEDIESKEGLEEGSEKLALKGESMEESNASSWDVVTRVWQSCREEMEVVVRVEKRGAGTSLRSV